ncbi:MAG: TolC family outer membrane protein [Pseudomonadota bacterium]
MKKTIRMMAAYLGLSAAAVQAEDLMDVYRLAVESDPQLAAAGARLRSTGEVKRQAWASFLPNLTASATYNDTQGSFTLVDGRGNDIDQSQEQLRLQLSQPIYQRENYTRLDASRSQLAQSEADYELALDNLMVRVSEGYFNVLTAEDALRFATAEETANARQLEQAEQRYEVGLTAITDVHEAQASYDRARANVIVAQNSLDDSKEALRELTGVEISAVQPLRDDYAIKPPPADPMSVWVDSAMMGNPSVLSRKFAADAAYHNIRTQRAGHYPTVDLSVTYQDSTNSGDLGAFATETQDFTSLGVTLTVPVYAGGAVASRGRQAAADYDAALDQLEQEKRGVTRTTRNSYRAVLAGISQVEAFRQAVVSAQSALEATEAGFEVGTRTIVDVLLAQRTLFQAQRDFSQSRHDLVVNRLRLRAGAGTIEVTDLETVNQFLK